MNTAMDPVSASEQAIIEAAEAAGSRPKPGYRFIKRLFDILAAVALLVVLAVPMLLIALVIRLDSPGPAIFRQKRMGQDGTVFTVYKFRTMHREAPSEMASREFVDAEDYITKIGGFLRRSSLDELPQLVNVLLGNMSFVGYRPVCLTETALNDLRREKGVFVMKPGITGLAQVNGRDHISKEEKVALDARYVRECSLGLDIRCLVKTVAVVITGEGVI